MMVEVLIPFDVFLSFCHSEGEVFSSNGRCHSWVLTTCEILRLFASKVHHEDDGRIFFETSE